MAMNSDKPGVELFKGVMLAHLILGLHLATVHNVRFMIRLMAEIRQHIAAGTFTAFRADFLARYHSGETLSPSATPA